MNSNQVLKLFFMVLMLTAFTLLASCSDSFDAGYIETKSPEVIFTPQPIDNFKLLDHTGKGHELFYYDDADAIVIMIHGNGCPIVRNALPDYLALTKSFTGKNVRFFLLNSNLQDNRFDIAKEADDWGITLPILVDDDQLVGESLGLTRTAEVLIIDPKKQMIVYRGPLNDRVSYERQKEQAKHLFVKDALVDYLSGAAVASASQATKGCLINFPNRSSQRPEISYADNIAPLLISRCVQCHQEGGIAPWSMSSYEMIQGFAPMIREVIRVKRMPPWHADPLVGHWQEDRGLSIEERQLLVHWIEDGAKRGAGDDPLLSVAESHKAWRYGEPDLVLDVPSYEVPETGVVKYLFPSVLNPLDSDVWVTAVDVQPGDPQALHHMYAGIANKGSDASVTDNYLIAWSPGTSLGRMPKNTAVLLPKGARIAFEMHYTPYGRKSIDRTKIALYFGEQAPKKILRYSEVLNHMLSIPAGARNFVDTAYHAFERDAHIYTLIPHSHYRGKSSKFTLEYPDGRLELLLSVPYYDFNWQLGYSFLAPKKVPAGSRLIHQTTFDNSIHNISNPDSSKTVRWGLQAEDEMLFGPFTFSWDDERPDNLTHNRKKIILTRKMGFLDRDGDGKIYFEDIPQSYRREFYPLFYRGDVNADKALTYKELMSAVK